MSRIEVLFAPAEFQALKQRDLSATVCVVFDVLRATSTMVTALGRGAEAIFPVAEIEDALRLKRARPEILLAGERNGLRIRVEGDDPMTFDLGNSPREFIREIVMGKNIAMTTTNGTKALVACQKAARVYASSFLNLAATVRQAATETMGELLLVCGGTFAEAAYEDVLCAGAMIDLLPDDYELTDSALLARNAFRNEEPDLEGILAKSRNGRRLLEQPELRDDIFYCAQRDRFSLVARFGRDGAIRKAA